MAVFRAFYRMLNAALFALVLSFASNAAMAVCASSQIDVAGDGSSCQTAKFSATTTSLPANTAINFYMSAGGTFYVDCGDGTLSGTGVSGKTITRSVSNRSEDLYSCTYTTGGVKTIKFGGLATGYGSDYSYASIRLFSGEINRSSNAMISTGTETYIASISGSIGAIFPTLGSGSGQQPSFHMSFYNMTNVNCSIPAGLFSGVYGTARILMFYSVFSNSTFTGQIPAGLFAGITSAGDWAFSFTFAGCTGLTGSIPDRLFANITSAGTYAFYSTFRNCTGLTGYIPSGLFAGLIANGSPYSQQMMDGTFYNTNLATSCPTGTTTVNTGYESYWDGHVACKADYPFSITTTNLSANTVFKFKMSAAGTFYVDWGDGSAVQTIDRTGNTTDTQYTHTYTTAGVKTIKFGGLATGYTSDPNSSGYAIAFGGSAGLIASVSGSIGAIFPTLNNGATSMEYQPRFYYLFRGTTNLTNIPSTLFDGIFGMNKYLFANVFTSCTGLTSIPENLFKDIYGFDEGMFYGTFSDCTSLTSIPSTLFNNVSGSVGVSVFNGTFDNCTGLTSIPSGLFKNISTATSSMFKATFQRCTNLKSVPYDLFSGVFTNGASSVYSNTFYGDTALDTFVYPNGTTVNYIPPEFFGTISGGTNVMTDVFYNNTKIADVCPENTTQNITGYESSWNGRVSCFPANTVTYSCGTGTGTAPAAETALYGDEFVPSSQGGCAKTGYKFAGWRISGTDTIVSQPFDWPYTSDKTLTAEWVKFAVTATTTAANQAIKFQMSASGRFSVNWGDGSATESITRVGNTTLTQYSHTYATAGTYMISFSGDVGGYSVAANTPAITFGGTSNTPSRITGVSGSLGMIFPTLNNGSDDPGQQPRFTGTFNGATNLTAVPGDLFDGVHGATNGMFNATFANTGLTAVPATLFANVDGTAQNLFANTFNGTTALTTVPAGLFSAIDGSSQYMFYRTFDGSGLTSVPRGLFDSLSEPAPYMFAGTFMNCTHLTTVPSDLLKTITGAPASNMLYRTFYGDTSLRTFAYPNGKTTRYIPNDFFSGLTSAGYTTDSAMYQIFYNTELLTSCPSGHEIYLTGFDSDFSNRKSCVETWPFSITTTELDAGDEFSFYMSAAGVFRVDWGDGTVETIDRTGDTSSEQYSHEYSTGGVKTIKFGGKATGYAQQSTYLAPIVFAYIEDGQDFDWMVFDYENSYANSSSGIYIAQVYGTLSSIFPVLGNGSTQKPVFSGMFYGAHNLTSIPATLFGNISGAAERMFAGTFVGCSSLTSIPSGLFSGISGSAPYMFAYTFKECTSLTSIPSDLFQGISGAADGIFESTFSGCSGLTSIPGALFRGISGSAEGMFCGTFSACTSLKSIPESLFRGISGSAARMFAATFDSCFALKSIPPTLFQGISGAAEYMFETTFAGCTGLTSIPSGLFNGISGAEQGMFDSTFSDCSGLTSVPSGLFNGISGSAESMFNNAFYSCTNLTTVPYDLFAGVSGTGQSRMFNGTFYNNTDLQSFVYPDGSTVNYIPEQFFGRISGGIASDIMYDVFGSTSIATSCPAGTVQNITGYESAWDGHVSCKPEWPFTLTTTSLDAGTVFKFKMSAAGIFTVDWGDGSAVQTIDRTGNTTETQYTHTYTTAGVKTIKFGGLATGYNNASNATAAIQFGNFDGATPELIASLSGSIAAIFPTLNDGSNNLTYQPRFYDTFYGATGLTSLPVTLFNGISGAADGMFYYTFYGATGLTSIPVGLFNGISGAANWMFFSTFQMCTGLTSIPSDLFQGISGAAYNMFQNTFHSCTSLTSLPANLFKGISGAAASMFHQTFMSCRGLTSIPADLFKGISGAANYMFYQTFKGCSGLTSLPENLFKGISGSAPYMFAYTFKECTSLTSIPSDLFQGISGAAASLFESTFYGCTGLTSLPADLFKGVSGSASNMFYGTFYGCAGLTSVPANLFSGISGAAEDMFRATFYYCTSLTSLPATLFNGVSGSAPRMFLSTFSSCSSLTTVPSGLFNGISGSAEYMFSGIFRGCTSLTTVPYNLFSGASGTAQSYLFREAFQNDTNLQYFAYPDGTTVTYIPPEFFGKISGGSDVMPNVFQNNTKIADACPNGTTQNTTGYESEWNSRVSCKPDWPFSLTTTSLAAGTTFKFKMSAAGTFRVDWGDGSAIQTIDRTGDTTETQYTHTYTTAGTYTIKFAGVATEYTTTDEIAAIRFGKHDDDDNTPELIASVDGSLGTIFPLNADAVVNSYKPQFISTFAFASNLTSVPATLFDGVFGMRYKLFDSTFERTGLTSVPSGLFSGVSGSAGDGFIRTFQGCTNLTTIPGDLFAGYTGGGYGFYSTFNGCSSLAEIPADLFSKLVSVYNREFSRTFNGCTGLTSIPTGLFRNITGNGLELFGYTFRGCTGLTSIPADLFSGITGAEGSLFYATFYGCTGLTSIPSGLFSGVSGHANYMFSNTFTECTGLTSVPSGLFAGVSGAANYMFYQTFYGCSNLTTVPYNLFSGVSGAAADYDKMFMYLFANTSLNKFRLADGSTVNYIPAGFFGSLSSTGYVAGDSNTSAMFQSFYNTGVATSCPSGTEQNITGFEADWSSKVSCKPEDTSYPFSLTTTSLEANTTFRFKMSAAGTFRVDWGDGSAIQTIDRTGDTTETQYTHTYATAGTYTIKFAGLATGYNDTASYDSSPTIRFGRASDTDVTPQYIASVSGSIGAIFPTLNDGSNNLAYQPRFVNTFNGCTNLTSLSSTLFNGVRGAAEKMFLQTFSSSGLTSIPADLFSGVSGSAIELFRSTFWGTNITSIPETLFSGVRGTASARKQLFYSTFRECTNLTSVPAGLFSGVTGYAEKLFESTFQGCTSLSSIPSTLFSGITGAANYMFTSTFYGCSGLTSIPATLFSGVSGSAASMFMRTFYNCTNLTSVPSGLFSGVTGSSEDLFDGTFQNCTSLTTVPYNLFAGASGTPGTNMFKRTFRGDTALNKFRLANGSTVNYVPAEFFGDLSSSGYVAGDSESSAMYLVFNGTAIATSCPSGTEQNITGFEADWSSKVSCKPDWPFSLTTTNLAANTTFSFYMSAAGSFQIDWGDGSAVETITRNNTTETQYTHTYTTSGVKTIRFKGLATGYSTGDSTAAIRFGGSGSNVTPALVASVSGSLGSIFPTLGQSNGQQPRFVAAFSGCSNLTSIPSTLFDGVTGATKSRFQYSFYNTAITSIPENLFSGITGAADYMFNSTFSNCTALTSIPSGLFNGISGAAQCMFENTFQYCSSLTSIPATLFSGVTGAAMGMFYGTFQYCSSLTSIPATLFSGVTGAASMLFGSDDGVGGTFEGCTSLTEVPSGLFSGVTGAAMGMFGGLFSGCTSLTTVPYDLFSGVSGTPGVYMFGLAFYDDENLRNFRLADGSTVNYIPEQFFGNISGGDPSEVMDYVFRNTDIATSCPVGTVQNITGYESAWNGHVSCRVGTDPQYPFSITTTNMDSGDEFCFYLSAAGRFRVDWGDGSIDYISHDDPEMEQFCHEYENSGVHTIRLAGRATGYYTDEDAENDGFGGEAILFGEDYNGPNGTAEYVASMSGSLGAIFPTINGVSPSFKYLCQYCNNLTTIPATLFNGISDARKHMFGNAFSGCTSLTSIPATLFSGITSAAEEMFFQTFSDCSSLTTIPDTLFSGIHSAADGMFSGTFSGCSSLTTIPATLFSSIHSVADGMFSGTFLGCSSLESVPSGVFSSIHGSADSLFLSIFGYCTSLTTVPYNLFSGASGTGQGDMFSDAFEGDENLDTFVLADGTTVNYIPQQFFGTLSGGSNVMTGIFAGATSIATTCPAGTVDNITGYEEYWNSRVSCKPEYPFTLTTTNLAAGTTFKFAMSAAGVFKVDWGDGSAVQTIDRTGNTTETQYTHTYANAGSYTIKFAGRATGYSNTNSVAAIRFGTRMNAGDYDDNTPQYVASISGSLGAIFPTLNSNSTSPSLQPRFYATFQNTRIASLPSTLFNGVSGSLYKMFEHTFYGCSSLTSIPEDLFSGISGGQDDMFRATFESCTGLTSIPENLFNGITSPRGWLFMYTFQDCTGLTSIPAGLFKNVKGPAQTSTFAWTFAGCTGLTSVPSGLFSGITAVSGTTFVHTFMNCTNLTAVPYDLFGNVSGTPDSKAFKDTFGGDTALNKFVYPNGSYVNYVPREFFGNLDSTGYVAGNSESSAMYGVFNGTAVATSCPSGTRQYITGFEEDWSSKVCCEPSGIIPVTLNNSAADVAGAPTVAYLEYGSDWFADSDGEELLLQMTTLPQKDGEMFFGYYTQENGQGMQIIDSNGNFNTNTSALGFTAGPATIYAAFGTGTSCGQGYYLPVGESECAVCTAGNYCPGGTFVQDNENAGGLIPCPAGSFCAGTGVAMPIECVAGSYTSEPGSAACTVCAAGLNTDGAGATSCGVVCPGEGVKSFDMDAVPVWHSDNTVSGLCAISSCLGGWYPSPLVGVENAYYCESCPSLYPHSPTRGVSVYDVENEFNNDGRKACFLYRSEINGSYIKKAGDLTATECPAGFYSYYTTYEDGGQDALSGQAIHFGETFDCKSCENNTYSLGGATACTPCLNNYQTVGPKTSPEACQIMCNGGYYLQNANDTECSPVGAGHYAAKSIVLQGDVSQYQICPSNLTTIGYGVGADEVGDCGRKLHVGDDVLYLRSEQKTEHTLKTIWNNIILYGNMSMGNYRMSYGASRSLKVMLDGDVYSVYDDSGETYIPEVESQLEMDPNIAPSSITPANFNAGNGMEWSATIDGVDFEGYGACDDTISSASTIAPADFEPSESGNQCWCKISDPVESSRWVAANQATTCGTKCGYFCVNNMSGNKAKAVTWRTALYTAAGTLKQ